MRSKPEMYRGRVIRFTQLATEIDAELAENCSCPDLSISAAILTDREDHTLTGTVPTKIAELKESTP